MKSEEMGGRENTEEKGEKEVREKEEEEWVIRERHE